MHLESFSIAMIFLAPCFKSERVRPPGPGPTSITVEEFTIIGINYDEGYIHLCTVKGRERERWVIKNGEETPYVAPAG
mgnify:CR=1 FL=1